MFTSENEILTSIIIGLEDNYTITWNPVFHRLRCNGHIINLSAQSFLFPDLAAVDEEAILKDISGQFQPPKDLTEEEMRAWRRKGPLGKIHNIVVYIQRSTQRTEAFKALLEANGLGLTRDNATRWNSWFRMLERALRLIEAVKVYCFKSGRALAEDTLSNQEWDDLRKLTKFLEAYSDATQASEGRFATLDIILPTMDFLLETLETGKTEAEATDDTFLALCCNAGWAKLNKYYTLTERSAAFIAAIVMCPQFKWQYVSDMQWPEDWIETARIAVQKMWESEYKGSQVPELPLSSEDITESSKRENSFYKWQKQKRTAPTIQDEYQKYINSPIVETQDPRAWWLEATQRNNFPNLSKMALDLLSIPAMSAEVERLFSSCKITITDRRNQIGIDSVEAIECLKSWMRKNNINFVDNEVEDLVSLSEPV